VTATASNEYHFISQWRVEGTCGEVADVLGDPTARAAIPQPPAPITYAGIALLAGAAAIGGTMAYLLIRARRK
jgi:hypothetical protein